MIWLDDESILVNSIDLEIYAHHESLAANIETAKKNGDSDTASCRRLPTMSARLVLTDNSNIGRTDRKYRNREVKIKHLT